MATKHIHHPRTTMIVAFGQVHAQALAKKLGLTNWHLVTSVGTIRPFNSHTHSIVFCETSRRLVDFNEIVRVAKDKGHDVPAPLHEWGPHAATFSGAFRLLEKLQGVDGIMSYRTFSKGGELGVYLSGLLVMHQRKDGMLRYAAKGEALTCPSYL